MDRVARDKLVVLSGGTGSAKFIRGLAELCPRFTVVANVGDNAWFHGLYVCPDVDIVTYTLAGIADSKRGWGIEGDRFDVLAQLKRLGAEDTWFNLGNLDLATHIVRTAMMSQGKSLTEVTSRIARRLGVTGFTILPATDQHIETHIVTSSEEMHLQEFWVKRRGRPRPKGIRYVGAATARPTEEVTKGLASAERIVFSPANPMTSITPTLSVRGFRELLRKSDARKVAVSPMIGECAFSGPAARLMAAQGVKPTSEGVAKLYAGLIDAIVIDDSDSSQRRSIEKMGVACVTTSTLMKTREDEMRLAKVAMEA